MKVVLTSGSVLWNSQANAPHPWVPEALAQIQGSGNLVGLVSMHKKPAWLDVNFPGVQFARVDGKRRKSGDVVRAILEHNKAAGLAPSQMMILGGCDEDFFMGVNSQTLVVRPEWVSNSGEKLQKYGIPLPSPEKLPHLLDLLADSHTWFFHHQSADFEVFALTNAGTYNEIDAGIRQLSEQLRSCLKDGLTRHLNEFTLHLLSSLYATDVFRSAKVWGWYPSSEQNHAQAEIMAEFSELPRNTFKCRTEGPLFIRHTRSTKRHLSSGDRSDPKDQMLTVHLNPAWDGKLNGKTIVVLDDYLTHGVSFAVAKALLLHAGAAKVVGVAMGKFPSRAKVYDIRIAPRSNVFGPLSEKDYEVRSKQPMTGAENSEAQQSFKAKFSALS